MKLKIGVTGHQQRDGLDWLWVRSQIDRFLVGKPLIVGYSSLAAGTDQVFAEAILERAGKLVAVIPKDDYSSYFQDEALKNFQSLMTRAQIIDLHSIKADGGAFLDAGKWIAREVDRLVAVWDGEPAEGTGGTGDVVAYALALGKAVHLIDPIKRTTADL